MDSENEFFTSIFLKEKNFSSETLCFDTRVAQN